MMFSWVQKKDATYCGFRIFQSLDGIVLLLQVEGLLHEIVSLVLVPGTHQDITNASRRIAKHKCTAYVSLSVTGSEIGQSCKEMSQLEQGELKISSKIN